MTDSSKITIFITGATGYIGGTVLAHLLEHDGNKYNIRTLVRSAETAEKKLKPLGVHPVLGSLDDFDLIEKECSQADVVLNMADADHTGAAKAIVKGLRERARSPTKTGQRPILIHTSGTGVLVDGAAGMYSSDKIYHDDNKEELATLGPEKFHRDVELIVQEAINDIDVIIVAPPTIWGIGTGPDKRNSIQIPQIVANAIRLKQTYQIGKGKNIWNQVHVQDLAEAYYLLFHLALEGKAPKGEDGYYFVENGEFEYGDICKAVAKGLKDVGLNDTETVIDTLPEDELKFWPPGSAASVGGNSRSRAIKIRQLGWKPKAKKEDIFKYAREEVKREYDALH